MNATESRQPETFNRVPPQSLEAEQAVLGSMVIEREAIDKATEIVAPADFYHGAHRVIFEAIVGLDGRGIAVDFLSLLDEIRRLEAEESIGGRTYLHQLENAVPTAANVEHYARIVRFKSRLRRWIDTGIQLQSLGYSEDEFETVEAFLERAESIVTRAATEDDLDRSNLRDIGGIVEEVVAEMQRRAEGRGHVTGLTTGLPDLDFVTQGLSNSELYLIGARTSVGKSALGAQIALHIAETCGPVLFHALEMECSAIVRRLIAGKARVESGSIRSGFLTGPEYERFSRVVELVKGLPFTMDDTPAVTASAVRRNIRRMVRAGKRPVAVFVDHIGLMKSPTKREKRHEELGDISEVLQQMAKEFAIPVVAMVQLKREAHGRQPILTDLAESARLEANARNVWFIHRPKYAEAPDKYGTTEEDAEIIVAKQQNGQLNITVPVRFLPPYVTFASKERELPSEQPQKAEETPPPPSPQGGFNMNRWLNEQDDVFADGQGE